jgi:N-acetylglutamate synthase-like GNAT family acetyltransferase
LTLTIHRFSDALAPHFDRINREWISDMYLVEPIDEAQLTRPREMIVDPGGAILFIEDPEHGIVGTCGLLKMGPRTFELIKMGVSSAMRGRGAGDALLAAAIARAFEMGCDRLFLLTNKKSERAIRMYLRHGFVHDADLLAEAGGEYARCNVAMRYDGPLAR